MRSDCFDSVRAGEEKRATENSANLSSLYSRGITLASGDENYPPSTALASVLL